MAGVSDAVFGMRPTVCQSVHGRLAYGCSLVSLIIMGEGEGKSVLLDVDARAFVITDGVHTTLIERMFLSCFSP